MKKTVLALVQWCKQPLLRHLLALFVAALVAVSLGVWFIRSSHVSYAHSDSFVTCATVLSGHVARVSQSLARISAQVGRRVLFRLPQKPLPTWSMRAFQREQPRSMVQPRQIASTTLAGVGVKRRTRLEKDTY